MSNCINTKPPYTLYISPASSVNIKTDERVILRLLHAYLIKYDLVINQLELMKISKGRVNPVTGIVVVNNKTGKVFTDFISLCVDIDNNQYVPLCDINNF